jgi:hypothetical protein
VSEHDNPDPYDSARFFHGIRDTAAAMAVPCDYASVRKTLDVFDAEINRSVVTLKATTKAGDGLYYRFIQYKDGKDLIGIARRHGLFEFGDSPALALHREMLDKIPGAVQDGLDFNAGSGLAKVWFHFGRVRPIEELFDLTSIPDALRAHAGFFARHGVRRYYYAGISFPEERMSIYPVIEPEFCNVDWLRRLAEETGSASDDAPGYAEIIASLEGGSCLGMTFKWSSSDINRWAVYAMNMPYLDAPAGATLPTLPPRLKTFLEHGAKINNRPQAHACWSFGRAGFYTKLAVGSPVVSRSGIARSSFRQPVM